MRASTLRWLLGMVLLCWVASVIADDTMALRDPALQFRYQHLTNVLRCPKCENQAIDSSMAPVASDMRHYVANGLQQGMTDDQIQEALVSRFGEYVLYAPPLSLRTVALWLGPVLLAVLAAWMLAMTVWSRHRSSKARPLNADERALLERVLSRHNTTGTGGSTP